MCNSARGCPAPNADPRVGAEPLSISLIAITGLAIFFARIPWPFFRKFSPHRLESDRFATTEESGGKQTRW